MVITAVKGFIVQWPISYNFQMRNLCPKWCNLAQCYATFYARNLRMFVISQSVRPCQAFLLSLMFVSKIRAYLSETSFGGSTHGQAPGLTHKYQSRLERPQQQTFQLIQIINNTAVKSFIKLGPGSKLKAGNTN